MIIPKDWPDRDSKMLISFSGGQTSAYMTQLLKKYYPDAKVVFANTGLEHEKTYEFIKKCNDHFGWNITCLEALVSPEKGKGTKYNIISVDKLSKNGEPFEAVVAKYGVPNLQFLHCTRETKIQPIHAWARDNLGKTKSYYTAIGIRADEIDRMDSNKDEKKFFYPLVKLNITKEIVNEFWDNMPFKLDIPNYLGNCVTCWKKSDKKLAMILKEYPESFDFFARLEKQYGNLRPWKPNQVFFTKHRSVEMLKEQLLKSDEKTLKENSLGCQESCEVF